MKVDLSALWQTLTKRTAALLADEQKRTGLLVAVGLLGLVLLGVSSWLPAKSKPETTAPMPPKHDHLGLRSPPRSPPANAYLQSCRGGRDPCDGHPAMRRGEHLRRRHRDFRRRHPLPGKQFITGGTGLVETIQTPQVQGVAVLCQGGEDPAVQTRITALVQALTGVGANHVTVAALADAIPHN